MAEDIENTPGGDEATTTEFNMNDAMSRAYEDIEDRESGEENTGGERLRDESGRFASPALRARLLALYRQLPTYPEVPAMLAALKARGLTTAILSNGSPDMLDAAIASAGIAPQLDAILSVEAVGVFKPHARVYDLVGAQFGCAKDQVLFVSSNGWDAAGAAGYGFRTIWVNRAGDPPDRLYAQPHHTLRDLVTIAELV